MLVHFFKKRAKTGLSCLFSSYPHDKYSTNTIIDERVDGVFGTRTRGDRMVGTDESPELWRHPGWDIFKEQIILCCAYIVFFGRQNNSRMILHKFVS